MDFYSVSTDGKVANWTMNKNELKMEPIMHLKLINQSKEGSDDPALSGLAGGCAFDFNKKLDDLFLVGTEEGSIHECSKAYRGQYIKTYDGHHMGVHRVRWNPFHADVFISCSADWTVKLWDHMSTSCILNFDLGSAVGDVCWSPYSSTVFAAVTTDGTVHVFDFSKNKREPLCAQRVVKRAHLTNASFNMNDFILIVGDDRGGVHSMKLSPNLRKIVSCEEEKKEGEKEGDIDAAQKSKMVKVLASIDKKYA
jgi:dynein intermediate chain 1